MSLMDVAFDFVIEFVITSSFKSQKYIVFLSVVIHSLKRLR